ncbi:MAG: metal-sensitive transcriptional regulator [Candidatus Aerophobetes bacterium]|nr:metal-sensitive transcriptional regulator [Candidatus Aerophobetes bacterium]
MVKVVRDDLLKRLRKVRGQISGLERMVEGDASCSDILMQISAVRGAVGKIGMLIMQNYMRDCFVYQDKETFEDRIGELVKSFSRFIR